MSSTNAHNPAWQSGREIKRTTMMKRLGLLVAGSLLAIPAFAHRPYEVAAGSFTRSDGVKISGVEHYIDGIFGTDPVSVQFRLADGTVVAQTERTADSVVVRSTGLGFEVYRFYSDWIPFASRVQQFDGFSLVDVSSQRSGWHSLLVHTRAHSRDYAIVLAFAGVVIGGWVIARRIPRRDGLAALRIFGFLAVALASALFVLVLFVVPVSPFIVGGFGGAVGVVWFAVRRFVLPARA